MGEREGGNGKQTNSQVMRELDEGLYTREKKKIKGCRQLLERLKSCLVHKTKNSFSNEGWKY